MLFSQIHGYLTHLNDFPFAGFGMDGRGVYLEVFAYFLDNVIDTYRLGFGAAYGFVHNALG